MSHNEVGSRDVNRDGWERSDFPIVCESCLGDNPYVRMQKIQFDKECKVCARPFTVFRWKAGTDGRYKKTEICSICAKLKNVCQTCLLDLEFHLPTAVRDQALPDSLVVNMPESDPGRAYFAQISDQMVAADALPYANAEYTGIAQKLARVQPNFNRNKAHVCTFWLRGSCTRGDLCPYRHEEDKHDPELKNQNIQDRYHGKNDPVAQKMLNKLKKQGDGPNAAGGADVKTVHIGNLDPNKITEDDLKSHFYGFGEIVSININKAKKIAFVEYTTKESAQKAIDKLTNNLVLKGQFLKVSWAKPQASYVRDPDAPQVYLASGGVPTLPTGQGWSALYPSMNPQRMGTAPEHAQAAQGAYPYPGAGYPGYPAGAVYGGGAAVPGAVAAPGAAGLNLVPRQVVKNTPAGAKPAGGDGEEPQGARVKRGAEAEGSESKKAKTRE